MEEDTGCQRGFDGDVRALLLPSARVAYWSVVVSRQGGRRSVSIHPPTPRYSLTRPVVWADHPRCASGGVGAWRSIGAATAVPAEVARGIG